MHDFHKARVNGLECVRKCARSPSWPSLGAARRPARPRRRGAGLRLRPQGHDRQGHQRRRRRRRRPRSAAPRRPSCASSSPSRSAQPIVAQLPLAPLHAHARALAGRRQHRGQRQQARWTARAAAASSRAPMRGLTGGSVNDDLDVDISYDRAAVSALVKRVRERLDRPAVDADVDISSAGVKTVTLQARPARSTPARSAARVRRKLVSDPRRRACSNRRADAEAQGHHQGARQEVSVGHRRQPRRLLAAALQEPQAGARATGSPSAWPASRRPQGLYEIQDKQVNPYWHVPDSDWAGSLAGTVDPAGPAATRSRRAGWASTTAPASTAPTRSARSARAASHGCVRMAIPDVEDLYDRVDVGTPVYIG